ncbi:MAG: tetratricopeptide repeat protein, partial [Anaerolineae bacterium]
QSFYKGQTAQDMIAACRNTPNAPEIEYIDRMLNDEELAGLYTACDCLVHPYRGEGFGLPIAEAMSSGRPVIVTGHGAALDFCTPETAYLIPAREVRLPQKHIGDLETVDYPWWADPDREALQQLMRHVVTNPAEARAKGQAARAYIQANFTWDRAAEAVRQRIAALCQRPIRRFASVDASDGHLAAAEQAITDLFAAGQAALDRDDLETAAGEFARLTEQAPDLAAGHTALGSTLMALGRVEEAVPALRRAAELAPQEPALHNQLGIAQYQLGKLEAAEEAFQAALKAAPGHTDALLNLIEVYRAQDRYVKATECIKQAVQVAPNDVGVLTTFGTLSLELGDTEAARSALQHLQVLAPDQPVVQALEQALGDTGQEELSQRET